MASIVFYVLLVLIIYGILMLLTYFLQEYFMFHPERLSSSFEFHYDQPFEEVIIRSNINNKIDGLYFSAKDSDKVVFYLKGNTRSIKGWSKFSHDFLSKGCDFFIFDYPGFGKSRGKITEENIYACCREAYDWLKENHPDKKIILYGRSLGAGFAAYIAAECDPDLLILDSPYISMGRLVTYYTRIVPVKMLLKYKIPVHKFIKKCSCPVKILHGRKDWLIPYRYSEEIVALKPDQVELFTIEKGSHNNLPKFDEYHQYLDKILKSV